MFYLKYTQIHGGMFILHGLNNICFPSESCLTLWCLSDIVVVVVARVSFVSVRALVLAARVSVGSVRSRPGWRGRWWWLTCPSFPCESCLASWWWWLARRSLPVRVLSDAVMVEVARLSVLSMRVLANGVVVVARESVVSV